MGNRQEEGQECGQCGVIAVFQEEIMTILVAAGVSAVAAAASLEFDVGAGDQSGFSGWWRAGGCCGR